MVCVARATGDAILPASSALDDLQRQVGVVNGSKNAKNVSINPEF
jgi:hypothetical protein